MSVHGRKISREQAISMLKKRAQQPCGRCKRKKLLPKVPEKVRLPVRGR